MFKKMIVLFLVAVLILSAMGCQNNQTQDDLTFIVPIRIDFASIAPSVDVSAITKSVLRNMHDAFYRYNPETIVPELSMAEEIIYHEDGRTVTVKLKQGMKFHNGNEVKADDVVYSYLRLGGYTDDQDEVLDSAWERLLSPTDEAGPGSVTAIDEYTVEFVLAASAVDAFYSTIEHRFADAFIIPKGLTNEEMGRNPIGVGPYKFVSYVASDYIAFERFEDYHGTKPQVQRVEFKIYNDDNAQFLAFQTKEVNYLPLTSANFDEVQRMEGVEIIEGMSQDIRQIWLNQREDSLFSDIRLRQAVNFAIDKNRILQVANGGRGMILDTHLSPYNPAFNNNLQNVFTVDKDRAKELMAQAGFPNGFDTSLAVVAENQLDVDIATVIQDELAQVGINVELRVLPWAEYFPTVYREFNYEMAQLQIVAYPDAYRMLARFASTGFNFAGTNNPAYDRLIELAAAERDLEQQYEYYRQAQQMLIDDATNVFLMDQGVYVALNNGFTGYVNYPFAFIDITTITKN